MPKRNNIVFLLNIKKSFNRILSIFFNKTFYKVMFCCGAIIFLIVTPSVIFNKTNYTVNLEEYLNLTKNESVVLNMWHIETFEGGTNSRKLFIENQAKKFNKQNNNCYISVKSLTEEQFALNLESGNYADIYSFGIGAGYMLPELLTGLPKNNNVRSDLLDYGKIDNDIYAYPFILSGYSLISYESMIEDNATLKDLLKIRTINKKQIAGVGFAGAGSINPVRALTQNDITNISKNNYYNCSTTYNAYTNFLDKKFVTLLGTARDVARIKNREQNGSIASCKYNFLGGYSDLVQYVSVSNNLNQIQKNYAISFAKFLTSQTCQSSLNNYGLFSVNNQKIYLEDYMSTFEDELLKHLISQNVFSNLESIQEQKQKYFNVLFK